MTTTQPRLTAWTGASTGLVGALRALVAVGLVLFLASVAFAPERAMRGYLVAELYLVGLGVGAAFFLGLQHVTGAGWSTGFRRIPEAMTQTLPVAAAAFVPVVLGARAIYPWARPEVVAASPVLVEKSAWLNLPFFALRAALYFGVWTFLSRRVVARSARQDQDRDVGHTFSNARDSVFLLVGSALTLTLASVDWIMSLDPFWFSTIHAVTQWAGMFVSALAVLTLLVIALRRQGALAGVVSEAHLLDLGRLIFGFTTFWAYVWFSQYMLIWYSNMPEETRYYRERTGPLWITLFVVNLFVNWAIPFVVLLPRPAKRSELVLVRVCVLLLVGRWLDLYLEVAQPLLREGPALGILELGPLLAAGGAFGLAFLKAFGQRSPVPVGDPTLGESVHHHA